MKKEDLTQVKHVGRLRMKKLNDAGIKTVKKLSKTPLKKLAQVESIGESYAKRIKVAAKELHRQKPKNPGAKEGKTASESKHKGDDLSRSLRKQINLLNKRLKQANENLKPLTRKKHLVLYIEFKKKAKHLKAHLLDLDQHRGRLSEKTIKKIIENSKALSTTLHNIGKKPKKKQYQKVSQEIQALSKLLKKTSA